jgi:hypothetical protein
MNGHGSYTATEIMPEVSYRGSGLGLGVAVSAPPESFMWGAVVEIVIHSDDSSNSSTTRYTYHGATGTGAGSFSGSAQVFRVTMNGDITESINWLTQYAVTFASAGILSDSGVNIVVIVAGVGKQYHELPYTNWYTAGSNLAYGYTSTVMTGGGSYALSSVSGLSQTLPSNSFTVTAPGMITGTYVAPVGPGYGSGFTATTSTSNIPNLTSIPTLIVNGLRGGISWLTSLFGQTFNGVSNMWIILIIVVLIFIIGMFFLLPLTLLKRRKR